MAEEPDKEVHYAALAGAQALRNGANEEAIKFMDRALDLDTKLHVTPGPADNLRWARWERQLGEAHLGLGNLNGTREHMQRVLKLLGQHEPVSRAGMAISLLKQVGLQFLHRRFPGRYIGRVQAEAETLLEATLAYERIGELHYFARETLPTVHGGLSTLNLAERFEPSPALARAYANMSVVCSLIPLYSLAESYSRRAQQTAAQVNERRALAFSL
jgi:tetratricopeptide (TPR) repeat protein